ncbi:hypothetical protein MKX01_038796 [Papaver californicum]|nr:hypothetical protein MKX01_038796 [Papaver californicum]
MESTKNRRIEETKQAAADVLSNYSQFSIVCIGEGVRPCMPTSLTSLKRNHGSI